MKPNQKQKDIIGYIKDELDFWERSNDINSPSHYTDMRDFLNNFELSEDEVELLLVELEGLFEFVKRLK